MRWRVHFLTLVWRECSIGAAVLAGRFRRSDRPFGTYQSQINERGRMMKKLLLGSTALVVGGVMAAPAMAADPIKMGIGGYYTFYALAGNIDSTYAFNGSFTNYKGLAFTQEGEIHFIGQTKLDNGTSVGLTVELEAWNPSVVRHRRRQLADRRSLHLRLRRLGSYRVGLPRRRHVPYVLRHAVGADRLGRHPAQPQLGQRVGHRQQQGLCPYDGDDHHADLAGRQPHQLLHAALRTACRSVSVTLPS